MLKGRRDPSMPRYVASAENVYGGGSASLGPAYLPFVVGGDPNAPDFKVENLSLLPSLKDRVDDRSLLLKALDGLRRDIDQSRTIESMDKYNREAVSLLTSRNVQQAFDISEEAPKLRDKYGRHKWGQRALLARRLVEAGTSFVTMQMQNPSIPGAIGNWDIHAVNGHLFDDARARLPVFDRAIAALIEDISYGEKTRPSRKVSDCLPFGDCELPILGRISVPVQIGQDFRIDYRYLPERFRINALRLFSQSPLFLGSELDRLPRPSLNFLLQSDRLLLEPIDFSSLPIFCPGNQPILTPVKHVPKLRPRCDDSI